jgi:hypothetical protein
LGWKKNVEHPELDQLGERATVVSWWKCAWKTFTLRQFRIKIATSLSIMLKGINPEAEGPSRVELNVVKTRGFDYIFAPPSRVLISGLISMLKYPQIYIS